MLPTDCWLIITRQLSASQLCCLAAANKSLSQQIDSDPLWLAILNLYYGTTWESLWTTSNYSKTPSKLPTIRNKYKSIFAYLFSVFWTDFSVYSPPYEKVARQNQHVCINTALDLVKK